MTTCREIFTLTASGEREGGGSTQAVSLAAFLDDFPNGVVVLTHCIVFTCVMVLTPVVVFTRVIVLTHVMALTRVIVLTYLIVLTRIMLLTCVIILAVLQPFPEIWCKPMLWCWPVLWF